MRLAVGQEGVGIENRAAHSRCLGNGNIGGQQGKDGVLNERKGCLAGWPPLAQGLHSIVFVLLHRQQVGITSGSLVADEAVAAVVADDDHRPPLAEQRHREGLAPQTVNDNGILLLATMILAGEHQHVACGGQKQVRPHPRHGNVLDAGKVFLAVEHLDVVIGIPVARYDHPSAVCLHAASQCALPV